MSQPPRGTATRIIEGVLGFQQGVFPEMQPLFGRLGKGQSPLALFITCSDSRINPNLLTQTDPGELFILRNAGNICPPHATGAGGAEATVEYALAVLKVRDIIVCGHSLCGAVQGLLNPAVLDGMPAVKRWLEFSKDVVGRLPEDLSPEERLERAVEQNVLQQLMHLRTYPAVIAAKRQGALRLHAWVYHFETGHVTAHDPTSSRFVSLAEAPRPQWGTVVPAPTPPGALGNSI